MILLDTHAVVWMDTEDVKLGRESRRKILEAWNAQELAVSVLTFWECALLHERGRIALSREIRTWRSDLLSAGLIECPVDGEIAVLAASLDLHRDPADRFIAATAIVHQATLVTADERLLRWKNPLKRQNALR